MPKTSDNPTARMNSRNPIANPLRTLTRSASSHTGMSGGLALLAEILDHRVDQLAAGPVHPAQVDGLAWGLPLERPGPARAVLDGPDTAERGRDGVAVHRGRRAERPV